MQAFSDEKIANLSLSLPGIIISVDKDFGELVYHHKVSLIGVILLRYSPFEFETIKNRLLAFVFEHKLNLQGKFVVITFNKIRIRTL